MGLLAWKSAIAKAARPHHNRTEAMTNHSFLRVRGLLLMVLIVTATVAARAAAANQLTAAEQAAGWKLLFDGNTLEGWRHFRSHEPIKEGWVAEDGCLKRLDKGGDIISDAAFTDFDLRWEWRLTPGANSGVKYFVTEERASALGHEYQLIDDSKHADALRGPKWQTAAFYDVLPATNRTIKPVGEWNQARILVHGNHVEHWLNGAKVLEYELGSETVKAGVAASKFKNVAGFGTKIKGHILLQDHGDEIWFRDLKIRELPPK